jgi:hypothetical protein
LKRTGKAVRGCCIAANVHFFSVLQVPGIDVMYDRHFSSIFANFFAKKGVFLKKQYSDQLFRKKLAVA